MDIGVDVDAFDGGTHLSCIGHRAPPDRRVGGTVEIGISPDDQRVLAAKFQPAGNEPFRSPVRDNAAGGGRAGELDIVHAVDKSTTSHRTASTYRKHRRCTDCRPSAHCSTNRQRGGVFRRLDRHGGAGDQCRNRVQQRQTEREVPRG